MYILMIPSSSVVDSIVPAAFHWPSTQVSWDLLRGEKAREEGKKTDIYRTDPCSALPKLARTLSSPFFHHFAFGVVIDPASFPGGFDPPYPDGAVASAGG